METGRRLPYASSLKNSILCGTDFCSRLLDERQGAIVRISEIFHSIQGEGKLAGIPSAFIRSSGCNLRCVWCDTPYTSWEPEGMDRSISQIADDVAGFPTKHVVLTGGEPMIAPDVVELTRRLKTDGYHVTIETAGTVFEPVECDLASISPKLANSTPWRRDGGRWAKRHEERRTNIDVIRRFMQCPDYQLKFVVEQPADMEEIDEVLAGIGDVPASNVLLMPQGVTTEDLRSREAWIAETCKERGFRYCPRLQIALYGNRRGT